MNEEDRIYFLLPLRCPFCNSGEAARVNGIDASGSNIVLIMFDCPFSFRFHKEQVGSDEELQEWLDGWREREGDDWLENLGPVIRAREIRSMERYKKSVEDNRAS